MVSQRSVLKLQIKKSRLTISVLICLSLEGASLDVGGGLSVESVPVVEPAADL